MTTTQAFTLELPTPTSALDCVSLFESLDLQQQAQKIETAVAGFCRNTLERLLRLGDLLNKFFQECIDKLGDKKGRAVFEEWLESGSFGGTKYIAKAAMAISSCFLELDNDTKELARKNVSTWSVGALKALAKAAKVSVLLLKALIKRGGKISEKHITSVTALVETKSTKPTSLPLGGFVEITLDDERQLKGKIGRIVDKKDELGNITVRLVDTDLEVPLKTQDITKKTPKAASESLLEIIERLHEESLQKELKLSEYQSAATPAPITSVLLQPEREQIAADAISAYKQSFEQSNAALSQVNPSDGKTDNNAALADANAKIEAAEQTIQKLLQQLESKSKLTQVVEDLQLKLGQKLQLESENQQLRQEVMELRSTLLHPATNLTSNQDLTTVVCDLNLENNPQFKDSSTSEVTNLALLTLSCSAAIITSVGAPPNTEHFLSQASDLETGETSKYQVSAMSKPANSFESLRQLELIELKKHLEISQRKNLELEETNEILVEMVKIMKLDRSGENLPKPKQNLEKHLGKNNSRPSQINTPKPLGFAVRKTSGSR